MAYNVELSESAERELGKLDESQAKRIPKFPAVLRDGHRKQIHHS